MSASITTDQPSLAFHLTGQRARSLKLLLGLALILVANFALRKGLERTPIPDYPIFPSGAAPAGWQLLLPTDIGVPDTPHWFTTGLVVVYGLQQCLSRDAVFFLLNALVIVSSFACTWPLFRSAVFSYTVAICMAFGTQFYWAYVCSTVQAFYLFVVYLELTLLCFAMALRTDNRRWRAGYCASLVLLALCHEQWLDYLAFTVLAGVLLWFYAARAGVPDLRRRLLVLAVCTGVIATVYLAIRLSFGQQQYRPGEEAEMIFTYSSPILAVEDFVSNVFTYTYMALSNYFPPCLLSSNSLYYFGTDGVIAEQHGYHETQTHLVGMHHLFYWYYFAGVVFTVFVYYLIRNLRAALAQGSRRHLYLSLGMLMIASGFALHTLVKYRPYLSVPVFGYKCATSHVGVAYLLAFLLIERSIMVNDPPTVRRMRGRCVGGDFLRRP